MWLAISVSLTISVACAPGAAAHASGPGPAAPCPSRPSRPGSRPGCGGRRWHGACGREGEGGREREKERVREREREREREGERERERGREGTASDGCIKLLGDGFVRSFFSARAGRQRRPGWRWVQSLPRGSERAMDKTKQKNSKMQTNCFAPVQSLLRGSEPAMDALADLRAAQTGFIKLLNVTYNSII